MIIPDVILPEQIVESILSKDEYKLFREAIKRPLPVTMRLNILRMAIEDFEGHLNRLNILWEKNPYLDLAYCITNLTEDANTWITRQRLLGVLYAQNYSSMIPPLALGIVNDVKTLVDLKVLDLCAAPGSKTTQLSQMMNNYGIIVANDYSLHKNRRAFILHRNLKLMGCLNVIVSTIDARRSDETSLGSRWPNFFNYVIADVPCTGTGTIREKNIPKRSRNDLYIITERQKAILQTAIKCVQPDGILIYSTCSYLPQENEQLLAPFIEKGIISVEPISIPMLRSHQGLTYFENEELPSELKNACRIYPFDHDSVGFFIAKLRIKDKTEKLRQSLEKPHIYRDIKNDISIPKDKQHWTIMGNEEKIAFWSDLYTQFGISNEKWKTHFELIKNNHGRVWMATTNLITLLIKLPWNVLERLLVPIAQQEHHSGRYRLIIDGVLIFHKDITKNVYILSQKQVEEWFTGKEVSISDKEHIPSQDINYESYFILKSLSDNQMIGCSKSVFTNGEEHFLNFMPKLRQFPMANLEKDLMVLTTDENES